VRNRRGFTLIELLIVVVIIGILAAIAIPKFAATKDKARIASVRTDLRNAETAEESYFSDYSTYATFAQLQSQDLVGISTGNTMNIVPAQTGYTATVTNTNVSAGINHCTVQVAAGASTLQDGKFVCS
jgi:type IV pilus assembly protein PilA